MASDDDDDTLPPLGEDTDKFLADVKKGKPRNFLLVCKGAKVTYLAVRKKPIKVSELTEAKKLGYKGDGYFGVVNGSGMALVFNLAVSDGYDAPPVKEKVLKDFLEEKVDIKCKPTFSIVATPPAVPFDDDDLKHPLVARFIALSELVDQVATARPDAQSELMTIVNEIRLLLQSGEYESAEPRITTFETRLKSLMSESGGSTTPPTVTPPPQPSPTATPTSQAPTSQSPTSETPTAEVDEALKAKLQAALTKLVPQLKQVIEKQPERKTELLTAVANIKQQIADGQLSDAKNGLLEIGKLLKDAAGTSAASPSETASADGKTQMQSFMERLAPLFVTIETYKTGTPQQQQQAGVAVVQIKEAAALAQQGKVAEALERVAEIERQLTADTTTESSEGRAAATADAPQFDIETEFARLLAGVDDRYVTVLRENPENAGKLRAVMDFANGKAEQSDFKSAVAALRKLETLLAETEAQLLNEAVDLLIDEEDESRGVVAQRKALLKWDAVRSAAIDQVRSLQSVVVSSYPDASIERLDEVFGEVDESLHDALIDCINAEDEEDRAHYGQLAHEVIAQLKQRIDRSELIEGIDRNPFLKTNLKGDLTSALDDVASMLG